MQIGNILSLIYLFLLVVQLIVNLKNKPEAVEKVWGAAVGATLYIFAHWLGHTAWE